MPKPTVHHHRGVYALVVSCDAILLVRKQRGPYRGYWDLPGGGLEPQETPMEALYREVREETGLHLDAPRPLATTCIKCCHHLDRAQPEELHHVALIYHALANDKLAPTVIAVKEDVSDAAWLPFEQLTSKTLTPVAQEALRVFLNSRGARMTTGISPGEDLLQTFHQRHPGATSKTFANGRTSSGLSSYELLCSVATAGEPDSTVLDLACGDGFLLELVHEQLPRARLIGVDFSDAELEAARARFSGREPKFVQAQARRLPLSDASVDVVLCHMSLMLMEDVEQVVAEIWRVLKPKGKVGLVVSDGSWPVGVGRIFKRLTKEAVERFGGACPKLGDNRTRTEEGLVSLFSREAGFRPHTPPQPLTLNLDAGADEVWESLSLMYNFAALAERGREYVRRGFFVAVQDEYGEARTIPYRTSLLFACFERLGWETT